MRTTRGFWILCLLPAVWAVVSYAQHVPASKKRPPQAAPVIHLDPEVSVEGYRLQPPQNYDGFQQEAPEGMRSYSWSGTKRKNGTRASLMLNLIVVPADDNEPVTLERIANALLGGIRKQRKNWEQTRAAKVTLHGLMFVRVGWIGTEIAHKQRMQGMLYVAQDEDTIIEFTTQDVLPYAAQTLPLAEACIRTFTKSPMRVFYSVQWPDHAQIYAMNPNGSNRTCLTPNTDSDYHPVLSPDGNTLAFTSHRDGVRSLYLMNPDGSHVRRLTEGVDAGLCAWSPDGGKLAFSSNRDGRYCIYVMNRDGSNVRRLTNGPSEDDPTWSPDGTQIAFEGMQDNIWSLFVVNVDNSGLTRITKGKWNDRWPQWSADGAALAYTTYEHGNGDIAFMHPDGTGSVRLTDNSADDRQPFWSADGRQILFHSNRAGHFDIYVLDLDTLQEHRLTTETKDTLDVMTLGRSHFEAK